MSDSEDPHALIARVARHGLSTPRGRAAAEQVIRAFGPDVLRLCRRRARDAAAADEMFQDAFLQLFLQVRRSGPPRSLGAYLAGIVRHLSTRQPDAPAETPELADGGTVEDEVIERIDLQAGLGRLSGPMRDVIALTLAGHPAEDIAAELDTTADNVRQLRSRARRILAKRFGKLP